MLNNIDLKKSLIIGKQPSIRKSFKLFDELTINFLNDLSIRLIKDKKNSKFVDLISFAFWCRKKNIINLKNNYINNSFRSLGRGIVLHIAPSNVPLNFAYSLAFGLLAGNSNIIRIPSKKFIQSNILIKEISKLLKKNKFKELSERICLIRYDKKSLLSNQLSRISDARVIWGGDKTIDYFKKLSTDPRCVDLYFADRFSISIFNSLELLKIKKNNFKDLCEKFYNDTFTFDQNGCSSPHAVIWIGKKNKLIKQKFWSKLTEIVNVKYDQNLSISNKKIKNLINLAINNEINFKANLENFKVLRLEGFNLNTKKISNIRNSFGTFLDIEIDKLSDLKKITSKKIQTITYFGYDKNEILDMLIKNNSIGVDRLVPIGRAIDISPIWDGYDIIGSLSRRISI